MKNMRRRKMYLKVRKAIEKSWCRCTSYWPQSWYEDNPAYGQCAVSSLVFQDHFGGDIFTCKAGRGRHYFNILDYGDDLPVCVDLTEEQYLGTVIMNDIEELREKGKRVDRKQLLRHKPVAQRYAVLSLKAKQYLEGK